MGIMIVGFTGSSRLIPGQERCIDYRLATLSSKGMSKAVTGACVGVDAYVALHLAKHYPSVSQLIVVPSKRSKVDDRVLLLAVDFEYMADGTSYRERNERIVHHADVVEAFWNGEKRSGTFMTINIAKRAGKLHFITKI